MRIFQYFALLALLLVPAGVVLAADGIDINAGDGATKTRRVVLSIDPTVRATSMRISNDRNFKEAQWRPVISRVRWDLSEGRGAKQVYVQFRTSGGTLSDVFSDSIALTAPGSITVTAKINNGEETTQSRNVSIDSTFSDGVERMAIVEGEANFANVQMFEARERVDFILTSGSGRKKVFIKFEDIDGKEYVIEDDIQYNEPANYLPEASVVKGSGDTVYYLGYGNMLHPFLHSSIFHTYRESFADVQYTSTAQLQRYTLGAPVCMRPGTWLVKFQVFPRVYAVEPGCRLRPIRSEAEAYVLYGEDWAKRIIDLHPVLSSQYTVREHTTFSRDQDEDRDGVEDDIEEEYGSSDKKVDSDNDKLSDYEEIFYWFTDPANPDTDQDGIADGVEVLSGYKPNGAGKIEMIPENTYEYPYGSALYKWWGTKGYYYAHHDGKIYKLANKTTDESFTSNDFQTRFTIRPPFEMNIVPRKNWRVLNDRPTIKDPTVYKHGLLTAQ